MKERKGRMDGERMEGRKEGINKYSPDNYSPRGVRIECN